MSIRSIAAVGIAIAATVAALAFAFPAPILHTPEFAFEKSSKNVQDALRRIGIKHSAARDNRYATWKAFNNQYWPAVYFVDKERRIVYRKYGEGKYAETEAKIQALLAEPSSELVAQ